MNRSILDRRQIWAAFLEGQTQLRTQLDRAFEAKDIEPVDDHLTILNVLAMAST